MTCSRISDGMPFGMFIPSMILSSGIITAWYGMNIPKRISVNTRLAPRKRHRESTKPFIEPRNEDGQQEEEQQQVAERARDAEPLRPRRDDRRRRRTRTALEDLGSRSRCGNRGHRFFSARAVRTRYGTTSSATMTSRIVPTAAALAKL